MPTTTLADNYRPLLAGLAPITSTFIAGVDTTGVAAPTGWAAGGGTKWRYCGCEPVALTGDPGTCVNDNNTLGNAFAYQPITIEFTSDATDLRVYFFGFTKPDVWAIVDGQRITNGYIHSDVEGATTWKLTQPTPVMRTWRLCIEAGLVQIATNAGAAMTPTAPGFQLAVIGDSYVAGGIVTDDAAGPGVPGTLSAGAPFGELEQLEQLDIWRCGIVGTGNVADGGFGAGAPYGSAARVAKVATFPDLGLLLVFGSVNDATHPVVDVVAAAQAAWTAYKAAHPEAPLVVVGPECFPFPDTAVDTLNDALKAAALAHVDVEAYVDLRAADFMAGHADLLSTDNTHLTHPGARFWAQSLAPLLGAIVLSQTADELLPWFIAKGTYLGVVPDTLDVGYAPDEYRPWGNVTLTPHVLSTATGVIEAAGVELRLQDLTPPVTVLLTPTKARIETGVLRLPRLPTPPGATVPPTLAEINAQNAAAGVPLLTQSDMLELTAGTELVWRVDFGPVTILGSQYTYRGFYFRAPPVSAAEFADADWVPPEVDLTTVARLVPTP